ncbi:DUF1847 domain-containing protein [Petroclostridium sp. X23]|uniref:DUF1847 domain-containing protein n=1 Tax=Petroclostridium sp. X23 TaxID=3045146 RepID=UPI0024AE1C8C|nr:DUF1847 domain-containing protein [Petroclostridium sp. X23]WHH58825.1 DUF1847 domain-containing protein [Petroclostridium sp. X23]
MYTCATCSGHYCQKGELEKLPLNCPCNNEEELEKIKELYLQDENYKLAYYSALVEAQGYGKQTRLEEIMDFANRCDFKKLGVAFCVGLSSEAKILCSILKHNGFEVNSVVCKNGSIPKEFLNIKESEKVKPNTYEPICNPIGQAAFLNRSKTDLNIILGLCVGHDSLFIKYSSAPVTVFAVKDRVLAHNPIGALYLSEGYYKDKLYNCKKI